MSDDVHLGRGRLRLAGVALSAAANPSGCPYEDRYRGQRQGRQRERQERHGDERAGEGDTVGEKARERGRDRSLDSADIAGDPGLDIPGPSLGVERQRKPLEMLIEPVPEVSKDVLT